MNILHISKYYYPFLGGVENICKYLVEQMPQHETSVVCFGEKRKNTKDSINGHDVYRVGELFSISRQSISPWYYFVLKRAIREQQPDIIQYHWANPYPALFLLLLLPRNVKLVVHWHMDIVRQRLLYKLIKPLETWLIKRADVIVVTSPQYREGSKPLQPYKEKIRIVPNCIEENGLKIMDGDDQKIAELKAKYSNKPIIFFMGRHTEYKGLPYLIRAEHWIKSDCEIVIAGTGELTEALKDEVARNKQTRIHFVGRLSDQNLRCYLHASSIFAFPSVTRNEAFGVALAEAMYCELPAVTFTIPGSGVNWVNQKGVTGLEVQNGNSEAYAAAIDKLLQDDNLRDQFGKRSKERIEQNFLMHHMIDAMQKVYDEFC